MNALKKKKELTEWQKKILKETGLFVIFGQHGQIGRYKESRYVYIVVDIYDQYPDEQSVLETCASQVDQARIPEKINGFLCLDKTVLGFKKLEQNVYRYETGHDYTD